MDKQNETNKKNKRHHRPFYKKRRSAKPNGESSSSENKMSNAKNVPQLADSPEEVTKTIVLEEAPVMDSSPAEADAAENQISFQDAPTEEIKKTRVVGIRFRPASKTYTFDPAGLSLSVGDSVIVETSQGIEFGVVSGSARFVSEKDLVLPLKKVLRKATEKDIQKHEENRELEMRGRKVFFEKVKEHNVDMALSDVECSFDRSKLIFYFTSEGRVDFRDFVKDMASIFKMRIELRQIGVRDEAKQLGGLGICGRPLCCSSFLEDFQQVSIKMAKEQNLSLNPTKISGTCGRLMCCLRYENDVYVEAGKKCPRAENAVMTPQGRGIVVEANILAGKCKVKLDDDPENLILFQAEDLKIIPKQKNKQNGSENKEKTAEEKK
jgi:cell fate regulator YaaT (PSP1 superfamily)